MLLAKYSSNGAEKFAARITCCTCSAVRVVMSARAYSIIAVGMCDEPSEKYTR